MRLRCLMLIFLLATGAFRAPHLLAQSGNGTSPSASVSYISGGSIYIDGGRSVGFEIGDTLTVKRKRDTVCTAVIVAVSSSSSSARVLEQNLQPVVGDRVSTEKIVSVKVPQPSLRIPEPTLPSPMSGSNVLTGYVALSYAATAWEGGAVGASQPGAALKFTISRLAGSGMSFSMYGRATYDLNPPGTQRSPKSSLDNRLYEAALSLESPSSWYGFSLGRVSSRYVAGMGLFDGAQFYVRIGGLKVGAFGGWQPDNTMSSFGTKKQKFGGFVSYGWGAGVFNSSEVTVAYGKGMVGGRLDRDYLYVQSRLRLATSLFFYQSAEIDMHRMEGGRPAAGLGLTNTYISVTYYPLEWLNISGGYDATRSVYLFETMRSIADTLVDQSLKQGFRGSFSLRLPMNISVNATGTLRPSSGTNPEAHTVGGGLRITDIRRTGISIGAQYTNITSLYTNGHDVTADVSWWMSERLSSSIRIDRYQYTALGESSTLRTLTGSVSVSYRFSRSLYAMVFVDQVWDSIQNLRRLYVECGFHF